MSEEFDFYGNDISTFKDDELAEMMEDIIDGEVGKRPLTRAEKITLLKKIHNHDVDAKVGFAEHLIEDLDDCVAIEDDVPKHYTKFRGNKILSDMDKELLTEYAPKLFNTSTNLKGIKNDIFKLVDLIYKYRLYNSPHYIINRIRNSFPTKYEKDLPQKEQALADGIETVLELMGDILSVEDDIELKNKIKEIGKNPSKHIPKKPPSPKKYKDYTSLTTIKNYLSSLKMNKKKTIDEFIERLEEIPLKKIPEKLHF